jgi:TrmH family RNA methyltransferase
MKVPDRSELGLIKKLADRKGRREMKLFLAEGPHLLDELMKAEDSPLPEILVATGSYLEKPESKQFRKHPKLRALKWFEVSDKEFKELTQTEAPQGILAVVPYLKHTPQSVLASVTSLALICEGIQDPANLGAIIRTAAAMGVEGIFLVKGTVDFYNPKVLRSAMGTAFRVPIAEGSDQDEIVPQLINKGFEVVATEVQGGTPVMSYDFKKPTTLVFGNEARGITKELRAQMTGTVTIPISDKAESLNVAMATGMVLYEIARQRNLA